MGLTLTPSPGSPIPWTASSTPIDSSTKAGQEGKGATAAVKLLDRRHPEYTAKQEAWVDLTLLKEAGYLIKAKAERLLKQRPREDQDVFTARKEKFTYQPILGTALGWYEAAMFKDDPQFFFYSDSDKKNEISGKTRDYYISSFLKDADGNGTSFTDFSKKAFADILAYGVSHVLVDLPARDPDNVPQTLQQEIDKGYFNTFLVSYNPTELINWKCDRFGSYEWVVIKTTREEQSFLGKTQTVDTWYYFDREEFKTYEDRRDSEQLIAPGDMSNRTATLVSSGPHALSHVKRVPLRTLRFSNNLWLANRAYLLFVDHLNQDNSLAWALFMSNLAIPVIIGDADATGMTNSETGWLQFPTGTQYMWSEPSGNSFSASAARLETLREEAFRSMYLQSQGMSSRSTPQMQSGRSKLASMVPTHEVLSGMGNDFRQRLQEILVDVKDARRDDDVQPDVRGFDYEDDMSTEEVFAVSSLLQIRIPSTSFERWIYKKVIKAWARDANQTALDTMYSEVDKGPTMDERMEQDLKTRMSITKGAMGQSIMGKAGLPAAPGRGGAGSPPRSEKLDQGSTTV